MKAQIVATTDKGVFSEYIQPRNFQCLRYNKITYKWGVNVAQQWSTTKQQNPSRMPTELYDFYLKKMKKSVNKKIQTFSGNSIDYS